MLSELLFPNQTRRKALAWLCMHPEQSIHLRELARQTSATPGTLKKELDALSHAGLLNSQRVGNQVQFRVNNQHPVFPELQALVRKTIGLTDVLQQALASLRPRIDLAFVYGSMASGSAHEGSDVDVLLVAASASRRRLRLCTPRKPCWAVKSTPRSWLQQNGHKNVPRAIPSFKIYWPNHA
jgi:DNA-binding transcriptional ArsR family regulator